MSKARHRRRDARRGKAVASVIAGHSAHSADTSPHAPTAAQLRAIKAQRSQPRKHAAQSDAVTGEPLQRGTLRLATRDWDAARELYRGQPIPATLHRSQMDGDGSRAARTGGYLGGPAFSRDAERYFAHAIVSAASRVDGLYAWWLDGYVRARLVARFGERAVRCAEYVERGGEPRRAAGVYQVRVQRVMGWQRDVQRAARGYFRQPARRTERAPERVVTTQTEFAASA